MSNGSGTAAGNVTDLSIVCGDATPQASTLNAQFNTPTSVAVDSQGNVFAADPADNRVQKVAKDGAVSTVYTGRNPDSVAVDSSDSLFVHDATTGMIYSFDSQGTQTTFVGLRPCCRIAARWRRHPMAGCILLITITGRSSSITSMAWPRR
jgi:streptogramin lyase